MVRMTGYKHVVFHKKEPSRYDGTNIRTLCDRRQTEGDIGLEIECEGNKFEKTKVTAPWVYVKDGSLRGHDNAEYILRKPIKFDEVPKAINSLWKMFAGYGTVLDESNRTSVHVHLNAQQWHLNRLCAFTALYISLEEILTEWCGDHRVGNLFCLRAKDAPAIVSTLKTFFEKEGQMDIKEGFHYSGLNIHALQKFGSIEIRALRGATDPQVIIDWVEILERLYVLSEEYANDPREVVSGFSGVGAIGYFEKILGPKAATVRNNISYDNERLAEAMYEGIRLAQDLCYCRDWSEYKPTELKSDPFGRIRKTSGLGSGESSISFTNANATYDLLSATNPQWAPMPTLQAVYGITNPFPNAPVMDDDEEEEEPDYYPDEDHYDEDNEEPY